MNKLKKLLEHYRRQPNPDLQLIKQVETLLEDVESDGFNLREHRHNQREDWLNEHCPDRRCPVCNRIKTKSKAWVVMSHTQKVILNNHPELTHVGFAVCKSCYMMFNNRVKGFSLKDIVKAQDDVEMKKHIERLCGEIEK